MSEEKVRENRLRRQLDRMGYRLMKSRLRDERAIGYGGYMIAEKWTNALVAGVLPYPYNFSIDDVKNFAETGQPAYPKK